MFSMLISLVVIKRKSRSMGLFFSVKVVSLIFYSLSMCPVAVVGL